MRTYVLLFSLRLKGPIIELPFDEWVFFRHQRGPPGILVDSEQPFQKIQKRIHSIILRISYVRGLIRLRILSVIHPSLNLRLSLLIYE